MRVHPPPVGEPVEGREPPAATGRGIFLGERRVVEEMDEAATELLREQEYQDASRAALGHMREQSLKLSDSVGKVAGDKITADLLEAAYARRIAALDPPPGVPLFFGAMTRDAGEKQYVGRRHVRDDNNDVLVMDWRAPASGDFYRASPSDRREIEVRRRFGHADGRLTAFEDEPLSGAAASPGARLSAIALAEIERPRSGPMRDIVATIQADQDALVRADIATNLVVQGGPGTGKTAVGLHRAAYLLYANDKRLERAGVLIVGPNDRFIEYIAAVLPALGEVAVTQTTLPRLIGAGEASGKRGDRGPADPAEVLRNDARLAEVCRRGLLARLGQPVEQLKLVVGGRIVRLEVGRLLAARDGVLARGLAFEPSRKLFLARIAQEAADRAGRTMTEARAALRDPMAAALHQLWPKVTPGSLLRGLVTTEELEHASCGLLDADERALVAGTDLRKSGVTIGGLLLLDEIRWLIERGDTFGHVVVDEAQDLSPMMLRAVARRRGLSMTLLGDIAQGTTAWAASSWTEVTSDLGLERVELTSLDLAFRSTAPIVAIANRLLPLIAEGVPAGRPVRSGPPPSVSAVAAEALTGAVLAEVRRLLASAGTIGVITCSAERLGLAPDERVTVLAVEEVKGLEFDSVVLVEPAAASDAHDERRALRHLYVAITRAVTQLAIVHSRPLPPALATALA